jgi:hypothetical protein
VKIQSFLLAASASLAIAGAAEAATITGTFASGLAGITSSTPGIGAGSVLTTAGGFVTGTTDDFVPVPLFTTLNFSSITATNGTLVSFTSSFGSFSGIISGLLTAPAPNATVNFQSLGTFTPSGALSGFSAGDALLTVGFTQTGNLVPGRTPPAISGNFTFASVSAVPEPASWAMLVAGFGLVGVATRRRQNVVTA